MGNKGSADTNQPKPFSLKDKQYNMDTYFGRMKYFFNVFDPRNSFYTNTQINTMINDIEKQKKLEAEAEK